MNYSEYINSRYGFVEGYEVKGEELLVKTPDTKKDKPHKFKATKDNITRIDNRLGTQYQLLINHQVEIIKDKSKKARKIIYPITATLLLVAAGLNVFDLPQLYTMLSGIAGISSAIIGEISLAVKKDNFKKEMAMYKSYIDNRTDIEQQAKQDKNIVEYLDKTTHTMIEKNVELKNEGKIEGVFNIDLMDKMALEQLRELLVRYKISQKLDEDLTFSIPNQRKVKTRTLKPQKPNNNQ